MIENKLPKKLSALITVALADLAKVEEQPDVYAVQMDVWHRANSHCSVCLAGSVMAMTFGLKPVETMEPRQLFMSRKISADDYVGLGHLNMLRLGEVAIPAGDDGSLEAVPHRLQDKWSGQVAPYNRDPKKFRSDMEALSADLAGLGL